MSQRVHKNLGYLFEELEASPDGAAVDQPGELGEVITPTLDVFGTSRYLDVESIADTAVGVAFLNLPIVPSNEVWYVQAMSAIHTNVGNIHMWIDITTNAVLTTVRSASSHPINIPLPILRPLYLGPGQRIGARALGAADWALGISFVRLRLGNYVATP